MISWDYLPTENLGLKSFLDKPKPNQTKIKKNINNNIYIP